MMLFKKYKSHVVWVENPLEGIFVVEFSPDRGTYRYKPGQFIHLAIDPEYDGVGQWPDSRCFSVQSSPGESTIRITYAVKGNFTTEMQNCLKLGSQVWLKLPYGDLFTQEHSKENTVFISGGTGITPFLSLFGHSDFEMYENPRIYLGFKSKSHHIYENQLSQAKNKSISLNHFYEDQNGIIDIAKIFKKNGSDATYFISGPPIMIRSFKEKLILFGVVPNNIKTDDWE
jgi:ferredoxin-NADP reductase